MIKPIIFYSRGYIVQYFLNKSWDEYRINRINKYDWFNLYPIGRIVFPQFEQNSIILDGSNDFVLSYGLGKVESSAPLHEKNQNIIISGHRDLFFKNLQYIEIDDLVLLEHIEGKSNYHVKNIEIVNPDESDYLLNNKRNSLTLITCYPFNYIGNAPKRYIVECSLIEKS